MTRTPSGMKKRQRSTTVTLPGILMSVTTTADRWPGAATMASAPSTASTTANPAAIRAIAYISRVT
jgi:hypothetical protein